jgi:hypothetical protein
MNPIKKPYGVYAIKILNGNSNWTEYLLVKAFDTIEQAERYMELIKNGSITKHDSILKTYKDGLVAGETDYYENLPHKC